MVDLSTVDLSIFLPPVDTMELNSFTKRLNWSLRFFSLKFLDFLQFKNSEVKKMEQLKKKFYLFESLSSESSSIVSLW